METYCVKEKKKTGCVEPSGYKTAKKWVIDVFLHMRFLRNHENTICERKAGKLGLPSQGGGLGELAMEGLTMHAIPWLGKKESS